MDEMQVLADAADREFGNEAWTSRQLLEAVDPDVLPVLVRRAMTQDGTRPVMSLGRMIRRSDLFVRKGRIRGGESLWMTWAAVKRRWP